MTRRKLATAHFRDLLIEEFRKRPKRTTHDAMTEVIIDRIYHKVHDMEISNVAHMRANPEATLKESFSGPVVERKKIPIK